MTSTASIRIVRSATGNFGDTQAQLAGITTQANASVSAFAELGAIIGGALLVSAPIRVARAFGDLADEFANVDRILATVQAVSGATASQIDLLTESINEAAAGTSQLPAGVAELTLNLTRAGQSAEQAAALLLPVAQAADLTGDSIANIGSITVAALNQFGLPVSDAADTLDLLATAANNADLTVDNIGASLRFLGPTANAFQQDIETTVVALTALATQGIRGTMAATGLRAAISSLQVPNEVAAQTLNNLGVAIRDAEGNARPLFDIVSDLQGALSGLNPEEQALTLSQIFPNVRGRAAFGALLQVTEEQLNDIFDAVENRSGAVAAGAEIILDSFSGTIGRLNSSLAAARLNFFEPFADLLTPIIGGVADLVAAFNDLPEPVRDAVSLLGGLTIGVGSFVAALAGIRVLLNSAFGQALVNAIRGVAGATGEATAATAAYREAAEDASRRVTFANIVVEESIDDISEAYGAATVAAEAFGARAAAATAAATREFDELLLAGQRLADIPLLPRGRDNILPPATGPLSLPPAPPPPAPPPGLPPAPTTPRLPGGGGAIALLGAGLPDPDIIEDAADATALLAAGFGDIRLNDPSGLLAGLAQILVGVRTEFQQGAQAVSALATTTGNALLTSFTQASSAALALGADTRVVATGLATIADVVATAGLATLVGEFDVAQRSVGLLGGDLNNLRQEFELLPSGFQEVADAAAEVPIRLAGASPELEGLVDAATRASAAVVTTVEVTAGVVDEVVDGLGEIGRGALAAGAATRVAVDAVGEFGGAAVGNTILGVGAAFDAVEAASNAVTTAATRTLAAFITVTSGTADYGAQLRLLTNDVSASGVSLAGLAASVGTLNFGQAGIEAGAFVRNIMNAAVQVEVLTTPLLNAAQATSNLSGEFVTALPRAIDTTLVSLAAANRAVLDTQFQIATTAVLTADAVGTALTEAQQLANGTAIFLSAAFQTVADTTTEADRIARLQAAETIRFLSAAGEVFFNEVDEVAAASTAAARNVQLFLTAAFATFEESAQAATAAASAGLAQVDQLSSSIPAGLLAATVGIGGIADVVQEIELSSVIEQTSDFEQAINFLRLSTNAFTDSFVLAEPITAVAAAAGDSTEAISRLLATTVAFVDGLDLDRPGQQIAQLAGATADFDLMAANLGITLRALQAVFFESFDDSVFINARRLGGAVDDIGQVAAAATPSVAGLLSGTVSLADASDGLATGFTGIATSAGLLGSGLDGAATSAARTAADIAQANREFAAGEMAVQSLAVAVQAFNQVAVIDPVAVSFQEVIEQTDDLGLALTEVFESGASIDEVAGILNNLGIEGEDAFRAIQAATSDAIAGFGELGQIGVGEVTANLLSAGASIDEVEDALDTLGVTGEDAFDAIQLATANTIGTITELDRESFQLTQGLANATIAGAAFSEAFVLDSAIDDFGELSAVLGNVGVAARAASELSDETASLLFGAASALSAIRGESVAATLLGTELSRALPPATSLQTLLGAIQSELRGVAAGAPALAAVGRGASVGTPPVGALNAQLATTSTLLATIASQGFDLAIPGNLALPDAPIIPEVLGGEAAAASVAGALEGIVIDIDASEAIEDLARVASAATDVADNVGDIGGTAIELSGLIDNVDDLSDGFTRVRRSAADVAADLPGGALVVGEVFGDVVPDVDRLADSLDGVGNSGRSLPPILNFISSAFGQFANFLGLSSASLLTLIGGLGLAIVTIPQVVRVIGELNESNEEFAATTQSVSEATGELLDELAPLVELAGTAFNGAVQGLTESLAMGLGPALRGIGEIVTSISSLFGNLFIAFDLGGTEAEGFANVVQLAFLPLITAVDSLGTILDIAGDAFIGFASVVGFTNIGFERQRDEVDDFRQSLIDLRDETRGDALLGDLERIGELQLSDEGLAMFREELISLRDSGAITREEFDEFSRQLNVISEDLDGAANATVNLTEEQQTLITVTREAERVTQEQVNALQAQARALDQSATLLTATAQQQENLFQAGVDSLNEEAQLLALQAQERGEVVSALQGQLSSQDAIVESNERLIDSLLEEEELTERQRQALIAAEQQNAQVADQREELQRQIEVQLDRQIDSLEAQQRLALEQIDLENELQQVRIRNANEQFELTIRQDRLTREIAEAEATIALRTSQTELDAALAARQPDLERVTDLEQEVALAEQRLQIETELIDITDQQLAINSANVALELERLEASGEVQREITQEQFERDILAAQLERLATLDLTREQAASELLRLTDATGERLVDTRVEAEALVSSFIEAESVADGLERNVRDVQSEISDSVGEADDLGGEFDSATRSARALETTVEDIETATERVNDSIQSLNTSIQSAAQAAAQVRLDERGGLGEAAAEVEADFDRRRTSLEDERDGISDATFNQRLEALDAREENRLRDAERRDQARLEFEERRVESRIEQQVRLLESGVISPDRFGRALDRLGVDDSTAANLLQQQDDLTQDQRELEMLTNDETLNREETRRVVGDTREEIARQLNLNIENTGAVQEATEALAEENVELATAMESAGSVNTSLTGVNTQIGSAITLTQSFTAELNNAANAASAIQLPTGGSPSTPQQGPMDAVNETALVTAAEATASALLPALSRLADSSSQIATNTDISAKNSGRTNTSSDSAARVRSNRASSL